MAAVIGGLYLLPFAGIMFLWFVAVIRDQVGELEDRFFATVFFGSGLLFVATLFAAAAAASTPVVAVRYLDMPPPTSDTFDMVRAFSYCAPVRVRDTRGRGVHDRDRRPSASRPACSRAGSRGPATCSASSCSWP